MNQAVVERLVQSCDFPQFNPIARHFAELHLGLKSAPVDGWNDGGSDLRIYGRPAEKQTVAVQISVRKSGWKTKARADAEKAKTTFGTTLFYFVSNRRVAPRERIRLQGELSNHLGIASDFFGNQEVAALLCDRREEAILLDHLGIDATAHNPPRLSLRDRALYSYSLISSDAADFKKAVVDQTILATLFHDQSGQTRDDLVASALRQLGLPEESRPHIAGRIDCLLQERGIRKEGSDRVTLTAQSRTRLHEAENTFDIEWRRYVAEIQRRLRELGWPEAQRDDAENIAHAVAEAMLASALDVSQRADKSACIGELLQNCASGRTRLLEAVANTPLDKSEIGRNASELLRVASKFPVAKQASSAVLYFSLLSTSSRAVRATLTGETSGDLHTILDASVCIPWLATKLHGTAGGRFSEIAFRSIEGLLAQGSALYVPGYYFDECATHLLAAWNYVGLQDDPSDLRWSTNGFVSHYYGLVGNERPATLDQYLTSFAPAPQTGRSLGHIRRALVEHLRPKVRDYGGEYLLIRQRPSAVRKEIEEELSWLCNERSKQKPAVLLDHDVAVLTELRNRVARESEGWVFLTWDKVLVEAAGGDVNYGWVIPPPAVLDLLGAHGGSEEPPAQLDFEVLAATEAGSITPLVRWPSICWS